VSASSWRALLVEPLRPLVATLRAYEIRKLRNDLTAGLTVAVVEVPQAMAYAYVAGVPPQYGLYTSIVQGALSSLFSSNEHLATGPTNTQSLLVAAVVSRAVLEQTGAADPALYLELVFALTLLKGLLQVAFAVARMGTLLRYVSQSVVVGFTAGAGVLIAVGQLPSFLGMPPGGTSELPGILGALGEPTSWPPRVDPRAAALGLGSLGVLLALSRIAPRAPAALVALAVGALFARFSGWEASGLPVVGDLPRQLPSLGVPGLGPREVELLLGGAFALAALGTIETVSIGKSLAARTGSRIHANQEMLAQGIANCAGAFLQNIAGSGSFTRSALNASAGASTRFASLFAAAFVAAILLVLAPLARSVPLASLAAILFAVAYRLVDWRFIARIVRTIRSDAVVCLTTFGCTLVAPLQYAIFIGIFLNVASYLRKASHLHMTEMRSGPEGSYEEHPLRDVFGRERVLFLQVEGGLFFGLADELRDRLARVLGSGVQVVVLRLKRTHLVDATILLVLEEFARALRSQGRHLLLCGLAPDLLSTLERFGLVRLVGRENVFETGPGVFSSARRALDRAEQIVGAHVETTEPLDDPGPDGSGGTNSRGDSAAS
jgi:SulP family sulfate permease